MSSDKSAKSKPTTSRILISGKRGTRKNILGKKIFVYNIFKVADDVKT